MEFLSRAALIAIWALTFTSGATETSNLRRRTQIYQKIPPILNPCPTSYPASTSFNLTETFIRQANEAYKLITLVTIGDAGTKIENLVEESRKIYPIFNGWSDYNDQALVAKTKDTGICYGVFMGTVAWNLAG